MKMSQSDPGMQNRRYGSSANGMLGLRFTSDAHIRITLGPGNRSRTSPSVTFFSWLPGHILASATMNALPQQHSVPRTPRVHLEGNTPAVLRFEGGRSVSGELQVVSLTGGLLSLPGPLEQGSQVKLMFLIRPGSVLAGAEMLSPVNNTLQPFRFVSLAQKDRRKLEAIIPLSVYQDIAEPNWMRKLRVASEHRYEPRRLRLRLRLAAGALGLITLGLASVFYLRHFQLLK